MENWGRNVRKNLRICSGIREFENEGQKPLGPRERAQK